MLRHRRSVFLDRDGTINVDTHFPHQLKDLEFIPGAVEGIKELAKLPLDIIVVSNQAGIALGLFTQDQMSKFNAELRSRLEAVGARIDAFYFCPHLEPKHLGPGEEPCDCAKPAPGMLIEAARDFEIDLPRSFLVGDKISDIIAGETVGCFTVLVRTGKAGSGEKAPSAHPTRVASDLRQAALIVRERLTLSDAAAQSHPRNRKNFPG